MYNELIYKMGFQFFAEADGDPWSDYEEGQDWFCECGTHNFSRRIKCRRCNFERYSISGDEESLLTTMGFLMNKIKPVKNGWICSCNKHNFDSRTHCRKCKQPRPTE